MYVRAILGLSHAAPWSHIFGQQISRKPASLLFFLTVRVVDLLEDRRMETAGDPDFDSKISVVIY